MSKKLDWRRAKIHSESEPAAPYAERKQLHEGDWYGRAVPLTTPNKLIRHGSGWAVFYPSKPLPLHDSTILARHHESGRQGLVRVTDIIIEMHGGALLAVERCEQRQKLHRPVPAGEGHRMSRYRRRGMSKPKARPASIL